MEVVAEHGVSVVLSSHLVADLERVCDYLVVLVDSRVQLAGDVDELLASHHRLTGPRRDPDTPPAELEVIEESHTERQSTLLVRTGEPILDPAWTSSRSTLEDIVLAYMYRRSASLAAHAPADSIGGGGDDPAGLASVPRADLIVAAAGLAAVAALLRSPARISSTSTAPRSRPARRTTTAPPRRPASCAPTGHSFNLLGFLVLFVPAVLGRVPGARRWSRASWRPAPTASLGRRASPAPAGWR